MKRAICLFLAVLCMFNCVAFSYAEEEIFTLDEPTEVLTFDEPVLEEWDDLIFEPELVPQTEESVDSTEAFFDEPDGLTLVPENGNTAELTPEDPLSAEPVFPAEEPASARTQDDIPSPEEIEEAALISDSGRFLADDSSLPEYTEHSFRFYGGKTGFVYSDSFLLKDNTVMWPELAKVSVGLAAAAYVEVGSTPSLFSLLGGESGMGYEILHEGNYYRRHTREDNDFVRYVIARKEISDGNTPYLVYCVVVQGTRGGFDWNSNFNLGSGSDHAGFYAARAEIVQKLVEFMSNDPSDRDHRILWTTGHSRGAAVSNIVAGEFTSGSSSAVPGVALGSLISSAHIFSYNFACPAVSKRDEVKRNYRNIINFNSQDDAIPCVPTENWGYARYGVDGPALKTRTSENFKQRFKQEKGVDYAGVYQTSSDLIDYLNSAIHNSGATDSLLVQSLFSVISYFMRDQPNNLSTPEWIAGVFPEIGLTVSDRMKDNIIGVINGGITEESLYQSIEQAEEYLKKTQQFLIETANMTDADFEVWKNTEENRAWLDRLESVLHTDINTRADLQAAIPIFAADTFAGMGSTLPYTSTDPTAAAKSILKSTLPLIKYFVDFGIDAIDHGHDMMSYVLAVNSMYYGYKGWYGNPMAPISDFDIDLPVEDPVNKIGAVVTIGESCFEDSNINSLTEPGDELKYVGYKACYNAGSLNTVDLGGGMEKIGKYAFGICRL